MSDADIVALLQAGRLQVDPERGHIYASRSNTPHRPCGALTAKGYLRVCVSVGGQQRHFMAHRIVWVSVHGPLPDGHTIDHLNLVKTDNRIANLESVPARINTQRAKEKGVYAAVGRRDGIRDAKGRFGNKPHGRTHDDYPKET